MLRAVDRFPLSVVRSALLDDHLLQPPSPITLRDLQTQALSSALTDMRTAVARNTCHTPRCTSDERQKILHDKKARLSLTNQRDAAASIALFV